MRQEDCPISHQKYPEKNPTCPFKQDRPLGEPQRLIDILGSWVDVSNAAPLALPLRESLSRKVSLELRKQMCFLFTFSTRASTT